MAARSGSGSVQIPIWAFAVAGFVLVVALFFAVRGLASSDVAKPGSTVGPSAGSTAGDGSTGGSGNGGPWNGGDDRGGETWSSTGGGDSSGRDGEKGGSSTGDTSSGKGDKSKPPGWLPWGPDSPNTDEQFEPDSIYDVLHAGNCTLAYDEAGKPHTSFVEGWKVAEGLAGVCLASRGDPKGMDIAKSAVDALRKADYKPGGEPWQCKDGDAYDVLKRFVEYYGTHPDAPVVLLAAPKGETACKVEISAVHIDGSAAKPNTNIGVSGTWPDAPVAAVLNAKELAEPLVLDLFVEGCCKDAALSFNLPEEIEGHPTKIDLTIRTKSGAEVTRRSAFTIVWEESPPPSSITPTTESPASSSPGTPGKPTS
ncbi:hypothetical protein [Streptomyces sannanensis]